MFLFCLFNHVTLPEFKELTGLKISKISRMEDLIYEDLLVELDNDVLQNIYDKYTLFRKEN